MEFTEEEKKKIDEEIKQRYLAILDADLKFDLEQINQLNTKVKAKAKEIEEVKLGTNMTFNEIWKNAIYRPKEAIILEGKNQISTTRKC